MSPSTHAASAGLLIALASNPAHAQTVQSVTVRLEHDDADSVIHVGDTVTWTLWVEFTGYEDWQWLGFFESSLTASNDLVSISNIEFDPYPAEQIGFGVRPTATLAETEQSSFTRIMFDQTPQEGFHVPAPHPDSPLAVVSFETTAVQHGDLSFAFGQLENDYFYASFVTIGLSYFLTADYYDMADTTVLTDTLTIIPTPASTLIFTSLTLAPTRRRR